MKDEKKKKTDLLEELNELKLKVTSLNSEQNLSKDTILNLESELTEAKNNENMLSSEIRNLQTEIKYVEANKKKCWHIKWKYSIFRKIKGKFGAKIRTKGEEDWRFTPR